MKILCKQFKSLLAQVLVAVLIVLSVAVQNPTSSQAAAKPTLSKTSASIEVGKQLILSVKNKVAKSTYAWSSSDKKVATVSKSGTVKAVAEGKAVITCKIKTTKATYKLTCKVTVTKPVEVKDNNGTTDTKADDTDTKTNDTDTKASDTTDIGAYVEARLAVYSTATWTSVFGDAVKVSEKGGTYTVSVKGTKDDFTHIGAIYMGDIKVQNKEATKSIFNKATIKIDSIKFNGVACTVAQPDVAGINKDGEFGANFFNAWDNIKTFNELKSNDTYAYEITAAPTADTNTLEITFTVSGIEL